MATALSDGYIYLIESDAGDNQNWLHTPGNIDLDNFTEGTDYCKIMLPKEWRKSFSTGVIVTDSGSAKSFDLRPNRRAYQLLAYGMTTSTDNADVVEKFIMADRHTSGAAATFARYYLIIRFTSTDYVKFTDSSSTQRDYCTGIVTGGEIVWSETEPATARIKLTWKSVW